MVGQLPLRGAAILSASGWKQHHHNPQAKPRTQRLAVRTALPPGIA